MKGIFAKIIADIPKDELLFDDLSFSISQQIHARMEKKGLSQKKIAATYNKAKMPNLKAKHQ